MAEISDFQEKTISTSIKISAPQNTLTAQYINCFWLWETARAQSLSGLIAPDAQVEFVFHFREPWRMGVHNSAHYRRQPMAFAYAHKKGALCFDAEAESSFVAFRCAPPAAYYLLGMPLDNLWDQIIPLDQVWGRRLRDLMRRLEPLEPASRLTFLEAWVEEQLAPASDMIAAVSMLINRLLANGGQAAIDETARCAGVSLRTLERWFQNYAGASPKQFQLIGRASGALNLLRAGASASTAEIANLTGYYDQAKMCRALKSLTSMTPSEIRLTPTIYCTDFSCAADRYGEKRQDVI